MREEGIPASKEYNIILTSPANGTENSDGKMRDEEQVNLPYESKSRSVSNSG
jgi:hypothetical protein